MNNILQCIGVAKHGYIFIISVDSNHYLYKVINFLQFCYKKCCINVDTVNALTFTVHYYSRFFSKIKIRENLYREFSFFQI